jgi:CheY-like chemotaxis protein
MVYGIVKSHHGYVTAESQPGQGATFRVYLPLCQEAVKQMSVSASVSKGGCETILIAEDNPMVSSLTQEVLAGYGYKVLSATNGRDALATYRERIGCIDLVIADVVMPELGGTELLQELKRIDPHARVLLSTGYSVSQDLRNFIAEGVPFIQKPYLVEDLARIVREVLDANPEALHNGEQSSVAEVAAGKTNKENACSQA